ncbi:MAG: ParA family protein [Minisyncoccia bacterium]
MSIISLVNQKGGVGKSTTTMNLGAYLVLLGKKVLLIDMDPQANITSGLGFRPENQEKNIYQALSAKIRLEEAIINTSIAGLDLIPSTPDLAAATIELVEAVDREFVFYNAIKTIHEKYDFVLIDCPPSLGLLTVNSLTASDKILIPIQCEYYALEGLKQLMQSISLIKENLKENIEIMGAVLTMFDKRNQLSHQIVKEVRRHFPGHVFDSVIPRNVSLAEAPSFGKTILEYAPESSGAKAYNYLAREVIIRST